MESWPIGLAILLAFLKGRIDIFLLTLIKGEEDIGYYQAAYTLMDAVVIFLGTVRASLFPNLVYFYKSDKNRFFRIHRKVNIFFLVILITTSAFFFLAADPIIILLYGASYDATVGVLKIFSLALIFTGLSAFMGNSLIAMDKQRPLMILTAIGCIITFCLNLFLIPRYGIYGSAWANIGTYSVVLIMMWLLIKSDKRRFYLNE